MSLNKVRLSVAQKMVLAIVPPKHYDRHAPSPLHLVDVGRTRHHRIEAGDDGPRRVGAVAFFGRVAAPRVREVAERRGIPIEAADDHLPG